MAKQDPRVFVEGQDDMYAVLALLERHGVEQTPQFKATEGVDQLLETLPLTVKAGVGKTYGFILDADQSLQDRWRAVTDRLGEHFRRNALPETPPTNGLILQSDNQVRLGVWLMPDNQNAGSIEDLLNTLIKHDDPLKPHAEQATSTARDLGAKFGDADSKKAVLHTWLAWQKVPGLPHGSTVRAHFLSAEGETAIALARWFKELFELQ